MSDRDRTADRRECGGDVAAYALGALDAAEAETFRRHLETCSVCKEELASFQQVVNELPLAAPRHKAPATMRRKVMREVSADARRAGRPAPRSTAGWRGWLVPRPVLAAGVALLVAVGVFVAVQSGSSGTRVIDAQVAGPGSAQLRVSHGHGSLVLRHFAPP
ncbi:MAG: zf-HC2 domain-containing protein, partial [Solirubrobacteraceae bacterium]